LGQLCFEVGIEAGVVVSSHDFDYGIDHILYFGVIFLITAHVGFEAVGDGETGLRFDELDLLADKLAFLFERFLLLLSKDVFAFGL
jgi:hypothetical protein